MGKTFASQKEVACICDVDERAIAKALKTLTSMNLDYTPATEKDLRKGSMNGHILGDREARKLWSREYEKGWEPKI